MGHSFRTDHSLFSITDLTAKIELMPELPEVETIKLGLSKKITGLKIKSVEVLSPKSFQGDHKQLVGKTIKEVWRRAKVLGIETEDGLILLTHLKMTGQLIYIGKTKLIGGHPTSDMAGEMPNKSTRVVITFEDDSKLYFNDQRRFGWMRLGDRAQVSGDSFLKKLGPEPLDRSFTWQVLKDKLQRRKTMAVKVAILDQEIVSGIGNIYAAEAVFLAKLDPRKKVKDLTDKDFINLHLGIVKSLKDGVKYGGSTRQHFVNADGQKGNFLDYAFVYSREGKSCKVCQTRLEKIKLGGRGTVFCPNCQML